ncbi:hypothetical protein DID88_008531 [Monilinia fructigena]|uniref:Myb-like domain-containing protein n=1 Tax=Monilinia fructigena TaxID=38457 RepID=A0A395J6Q5_9HELO|nr:hypothetical protein DID88_008531 [Monilinia fructigena]
MRTTIEPRLMSFLNNDTSESLTNSPPSLELPPLHDRNILQPSHRPLLLEPNTITITNTNNNTGTQSGESSSSSSSSSSQVSQHSSSIALVDDNEINCRDTEEGLSIGKVGIGKETGTIERTLGSSSPQSLRKILDDNTGNARPLHPKKQQRVDLKDRFRTCCPDELRGESRKSRNHSTGHKENNAGDLMFGKDQEANGTALNSASSQLLNTGRKPRSHRRRLTDLQQLGIQGPFKQSDRRERRPFSEQDDREIAQGYAIYGPAWSKILRDPQFNLQARQPTDLRDRFRNKYPEKFRSGEDDAARTAPQNRPAQVDDSLNTFNNPTADSATFNFSNEPLKHTVEPTDGLSFSQSFDWSPPFPGNINEMDISRLLDDDHQTLLNELKR